MKLIRHADASKVLEVLKGSRSEWITKFDAANMLDISSTNAGRLIEEMESLGFLVAGESKRPGGALQYTLARAWGGQCDGD